MKIHTTIAVCVLASLVFMTGCAKVPDKLVSPTLKIEMVVADNKEVFKLTLSTGIQNENSDVALTALKGRIVFYDSGKKGAPVMSLPFELPVILPFETGIIEIEKTYTENEIMPLVMAMGSDKEKLLADRGLERTFMDDKGIGLELISYNKEDILDILKGKLNEKN
jgi:hypothetical protein